MLPSQSRPPFALIGNTSRTQPPRKRTSKSRVERPWGAYSVPSIASRTSLFIKSITPEWQTCKMFKRTVAQCLHSPRALSKVFTHSMLSMLPTRNWPYKDSNQAKPTTQTKYAKVDSHWLISCLVPSWHCVVALPASVKSFGMFDSCAVCSGIDSQLFMHVCAWFACMLRLLCRCSVF